MFPLVILAVVVAGTLAGCTSTQSPPSSDATTEPEGEIPTSRRTSVTSDASSNGRRSDASTPDSYNAGRNDQESLEALRAGVGVASNMCDWYNTDFEKSFCRTLFGFTDIYLESEQNRGQ